MIIVRIWEGLGNQMFQYAYARALKEKGRDVRIDLDKAYDDVFRKYRNSASRENSVQNFRLSLFPLNMKRYRKYNYINRDTWVREAIYWLQANSLWKYKFYEEREPGYSESMEEIEGNYYIKGWFQSEEYFKSIRPILLKEFVPRKKLRIPGKLRAALNDSESVSLHVRRGDYVRLNLALDIGYYVKAMEHMEQIYENPIFVVFSDDLEWVKKNLPIKGRFILANDDKNLKDYEELFLMSRCRSNIISNSTFSWWGAWLNQNQNKVVIAPKKWYKAQRNIVPKEWTVL